MQEIKAAFGGYMRGFYDSLVPTTEAMREYVARGFSTSVAIAPGRMIDAAKDMLALWRKNDNSGTAVNSSFLPIVIVALAKDYVPVFGDFSRQLSESEYVIIPADQRERIFKLKQIQGERRVQLAIIAADEPTARSIVMQWGLYTGAIANRRFDVPYLFAGVENAWPTMLETIDAAAINVESDEKNLTILAIDMTVKESIPLFSAPKAGEPNDGKGTDPVTDPSGYVGVQHITVMDKISQINGDVDVGLDDPVWSKAAGAP